MGVRYLYSVSSLHCPDFIDNFFVEKTARSTIRLRILTVGVCRGRDRSLDAEGATAPETLRQKDRHSIHLLERVTIKVAADGITISGKDTEGAH